MRLLLVLAAVSLSACVGNSYSYDHSRQRMQAQAEEEARIPTWKTVEITPEEAEIGMAALRETLRDPESAIFSDLYGARRIDGNGSLAICGYVNAKNGYGGYAGKRRFFAFPTIAALWDPSPDYGYSGDNEMLLDACVRR